MVVVFADSCTNGWKQVIYFGRGKGALAEELG